MEKYCIVLLVGLGKLFNADNIRACAIENVPGPFYPKKN